MGQIVSLAAKPKRCNLNQLSQVPTPAAGEYILVSLDNSMNAAGQGNFDCYIVGNGTMAATALELKSLADDTPISEGKNSISSGGAFNAFHFHLSKPLTYRQGHFFNGVFNDTITTRVCAIMPQGVHLKLKDGYQINLAYIANMKKLSEYVRVDNSYTKFDKLGYTYYDYSGNTNWSLIVTFSKKDGGVVSINDNPVEDYYIGVIETLTINDALLDDELRFLKKSFQIGWVDITDRFPLRFDLVAGYTACRISPTSGLIAAASGVNSGVTDLIPVRDFGGNTDIRISSHTLSVNCAVAYYKADGTFLSMEFSNIQISNQSITIPSDAYYLRFATSYKSEYKVEIYTQYIKKYDDEIASIGSDISTLEQEIQDAGIYDAANALTTKNTKTLYLGSNIVDLSDASFDSAFWSIVDGKINFLGGSNATPFVCGGTTENNAYYLITALQSDSAAEDGPTFQIGDGYVIDPYNGTMNLQGSGCGNGGSLKIYPKVTRTFSLQSLEACKLVDENDAISTKVVEIYNADMGNSSLTLVDGKWNVAIGPRGHTMPVNVGGSRSIAIGLNALRQWFAGFQNIAIGTFAAPALEYGLYNIIIGADALFSARTAEGNIAIGKASMCGSGTPKDCVAIGMSTLHGFTGECKQSIAIGKAALYKGISESIGIGYNAGLGNSGVANVLIGNNAGSSNNSASQCVVIGRNAGVSGNYSYSVVIGNNVVADKSHQVKIGDANITEVILGNKKLIFNQDGTVSWESVS